MKRIFCFFLALLCMSFQSANGQNWMPAPFNDHAKGAEYFIDTVENVMYIGGQIDSINHVSCRLVKWDGVKLTYMQAPYHVRGVTNYQGKLHAKVSSIIYRLDDTGWCKLNSDYDLWHFYPYVNGRLFVNRFITDTPSGDEHIVISYMDRGVLRDTFALDTIVDERFSWVTSIAWYKGELYFGGNINSNSKPEISEILRFDGKNWKDVAGGIQGGGLAHVNSMLIWKDDLYVAGSFMESSGAMGNSILRWDGQGWHRLGDGLALAGGYQSSVYSMVAVDDALYVVGAFEFAGGIRAPGIAKWDGTKWCSVSDTFDPEWPLYTMAAYKDKLYIAGSFRTINGDSSFKGTAIWTGKGFDVCSEPVSVAAPAAATDISLYPNPATRSMHIRSSQPVTHVQVRDLLGRTVYQSRAYDAKRGIDLSVVPPGMYIAEIGMQEGSVALKLVKE